MQKTKLTFFNYAPSEKINFFYLLINYQEIQFITVFFKYSKEKKFYLWIRKSEVPDVDAPLSYLLVKQLKNLMCGNPAHDTNNNLSIG